MPKYGHGSYSTVSSPELDFSAGGGVSSPADEAVSSPDDESADGGVSSPADEAVSSGDDVSLENDMANDNWYIRNLQNKYFAASPRPLPKGRIPKPNFETAGTQEATQKSEKK